MTSRRLTVRVLVVNTDGKVLVLRRSLNDENVPGRVDFPGGGVEPGETCDAAMLRELEEEAGLQVEETGLQLVYTFTRYETDTGAAVIRLLYLTHVSDQQVHLSHEHDAYMWQSPEEVERLFADISWSEAIRFVREHQLLGV